MKNKKIKYFLFIIMMLIGIKQVSALDTTTNDNIVDFSKKGSIEITLSEVSENLPVSNADITIYKIADAISKDNNLSFNYHESLKESEFDLKEAKITNEILEIVTENEIPNFSKTTNNIGVVEFANLDLGLYLVTQTNQVEGFSSIAPFLVFIPKVIDNKWTYDIKATPKVDIIRLFDLTVEKVWNVSTNTKVPNEVTIELLKDNKVIDTIKLNNENNWNYTWKQIEKSDDYTIREKDIPIGYTATITKEDNKYIITNTKELVQTGKNNLISPILALSGLMLITIGFIIEKRKNYE